MSAEHIIIYTLLLMGFLGFAGAIILYLTAKKFRVDEDPRIDQIESLLPGANCGACGCRGCRDFACECVKRGSLDGLNCPGAGNESMQNIASLLGVDVSRSVRNVAVLKCNGSCSARTVIYEYDGARSCAVMDSVGCGTRGCAYGCLGCGDCVSVCRFGALRIDENTGLPVIDEKVCTGCGVCVGECPRHLIELRPEGRRGRRVWVACSNREKGAVARKICTAACIGCGKCLRTCPFGAIDVSDNLAYINPDLCKACGKCLTVCPTGAILATFENITKDKTTE